MIVFTTDNGGPAAGFNTNAASNWPLKGVRIKISFNNLSWIVKRVLINNTIKGERNA